MEVDYSTTCDEKIPLCRSMASEGLRKIIKGLNILYALEKKTRTVNMSFVLVSQTFHQPLFCFPVDMKIGC